MRRETLVKVVSGILLSLAIIALPEQFLFSKVVPNSFWVNYFPVPFGAGWFITFIILIPAVWLGRSLSGSVKGAILVVLASILIATPISVAIVGGALSINNVVLNQYLWVGATCFPPYLFHLLLRWGLSSLKKVLTKLC